MEQRSIYTRAEEVKDRFGMTSEEAGRLDKIIEKYPMSVPDYYLSLADSSDPEDPIRRMCIPSPEELDSGGDTDTSGEADNTVALGLQHKYSATVLILSTNRCAMYCRHCFRKRMVGATEAEINKNFLNTVRYISEHKEVSNVLLSGGDFLMLSDQMIKSYLQAFSEMEHLDFIRLGTRIPVVMPDRVRKDLELQETLREYAKKKQLFIITQFNHPREITKEAFDCIRIFREAGIIVRNQTVLLKGVNDRPEILGELLRRLTAVGVLPYYVFQCRPVRGVKSRFQVPIEEGVRIVDGAKEMQNGQGKSFRYCMSLPQGKVEILGKLEDGKMLFKFHQAKEEKDSARIFTKELEPGQCWLELE